MAIYHMSAQIIGRSAGRSSVAAAAYRSAERIRDERTGQIHDYTKRHGIESEIHTPGSAPEWMRDRSRLWNAAEEAETRKDAQLAREMNIALPKELSADEQKELVRSFVREEFVKRGMVADVAYHHNDPDNPHAHVMLTLRDVTPEGFGSKNRDWNHRDLLDAWREKWEEHANQALERAGRNERIDHRTLEAQGINREPTRHLGPAAAAMERKHIPTERGEAARGGEAYRGQVIEFEKAKAELECLRAEKNQPRRAGLRPWTGPEPERTARIAELRKECALEKAEQQAAFWRERLGHIQYARAQAEQTTGAARQIQRLQGQEAYAARLLEYKTRDVARHREDLEKLRAQWDQTPGGRFLHRVMYEGIPSHEAHHLAGLERERGGKALCWSETVTANRDAALAEKPYAAREDAARARLKQVMEDKETEKALYAAWREAADAVKGHEARRSGLGGLVRSFGPHADEEHNAHLQAIQRQNDTAQRYSRLAGQYGAANRDLRATLEREAQSAAQRLTAAQTEARPYREAAQRWHEAKAIMEYSANDAAAWPHPVLDLRHQDRLKRGWDPESSSAVRVLELRNGGRPLTARDWDVVDTLHWYEDDAAVRAAHGGFMEEQVREHASQAREGVSGERPQARQDRQNISQQQRKSIPLHEQSVSVFQVLAAAARRVRHRVRRRERVRDWGDAGDEE